MNSKEVTPITASATVMGVTSLTHSYLHVEALCAKTREENFAKANSPMRSQGLRRFDANLVSE